MKKLILFSSLLLVGCDFSPSVFLKPGTVGKIVNHNNSCNYYVYYQIKPVTRETSYSEFIFTDTCNKYKIGDTIIFTKQ